MWEHIFHWILISLHNLMLAISQVIISKLIWGNLKRITIIA